MQSCKPQLLSCAASTDVEKASRSRMIGPVMRGTRAARLLAATRAKLAPPDWPAAALAYAPGLKQSQGRRCARCRLFMIRIFVPRGEVGERVGKRRKKDREFDRVHYFYLKYYLTRKNKHPTRKHGSTQPNLTLGKSRVLAVPNDLTLI